MNSSTQKALSVLLLASLLRGMLSLGVLLSTASGFSPLSVEWRDNGHDSSWDDLIDALAEQKKEEKEEREESEGKNKEKEGAETKEELEGRRRWSHECLPVLCYAHQSAETILIYCQHVCEVAYHHQENGYKQHHAAVSQEMYLRYHNMKVPCSAFV